MSIDFKIERRNTHLPPFHLVYHEDSSLLSHRDKSLKKTILSFFSEQNYAMDPRYRSCIRFRPMEFSEKEVVVIIGVWKQLRKARELQISSAQRFRVGDLADITLFNKKGKTLIIHLPEKGSAKGALKKYHQSQALMISSKKVCYIKEETTLDSIRKPKIDRASSPQFCYAYSPLSHKAGFIQFCELFRWTHDLTLAELFEWRACYKFLSREDEWSLLAKISSFIKQIHRSNYAYGGFKHSDLFIKFEKEALDEYACHLKDLGKCEHLLFPLECIERLQLRDKPLEVKDVTSSYWEAKILDLSSVFNLFEDLIIKSSSIKQYSRAEVKLLLLFHRKSEKVLKSLKRAYEEEDFEGFSSSQNCDLAQIFNILQHFSSKALTFPFEEIKTFLFPQESPPSVEMEMLALSISEIRV